MGMSIFASGAAKFLDSINYVKKPNLDYVVFGSSQLKNIEYNLNYSELDYCITMKYFSKNLSVRF